MKGTVLASRGKTGNLNRLGRRLFGIVLGGLFVYAGFQKLLHPYEFAEAVMAYQLLPLSLVGLVVAVLPWVEIAAGLCLAGGAETAQLSDHPVRAAGRLSRGHPYHHGPGPENRLWLRPLFPTPGGSDGYPGRSGLAGLGRRAVYLGAYDRGPVSLILHRKPKT